jgi:alpha-tubulin suppressor-like RCC1 family protein
MFGSRNFLFAKGAGDPGIALFSWGNNSYGGLGRGNTTNYSVPVQVGQLVDWDYPTMGGITNHSTLCTKTDGTLWAWGNGSTGCLGTGNSTSRSSPVQVGSLTNWKRPAIGGGYTSFCIKTDGTLWSWGSAYVGTTGQNNLIDRSSPVQVGSLTDWSKIGQVTYRNILCVKTNGTLFAWGDNNNGGLGLNDTDNRSSPVQVGALTTWANPATGYRHSLCVKTDGTLWTWGRNNAGQLGLGDTTNRSSPVQVGALTNWAKPTGGANTSACVKTDGTLWTWGVNGSGQLGLGNTTSYSSPVQVGALTNWSYVRASWSPMAGVKTDGTLWSWGLNTTYGQLGLGDTTNRSSPVQVGTSTTWGNVTAARTAMLCTKEGPTSAPSNTSVPVISGIAQEGETLTSTTGVWNNLFSFAFQWQRGTSDIVGATSSTYTAVTADVGSTLRCVVTATNAKGSASANSANTATVTAYPGKLFSWGLNSNGQLGLGDAYGFNRSSPVQVGAETLWAKRATSRSVLAVKTNGQLWSWGYNGVGQLGQGNTTGLSSPVQVGALTNWATPGVSGSNTSACVKTDGTLWTWGGNGTGQLGLGDTTNRSSPVQVGALTNWATPLIGSSSNQFLLCTKTDGTLWAWGRGNDGALGLGNTTNYYSPVQVGALTNWKTPVAGGSFVICSKTDGTLWSWGNNSYGYLGLGNNTSYSSPKQIGSLTNWATPVAGNNFAACVKTDGTLWAWGKNDFGQLGLENQTNYSSPKQIGALTNWKTPAGGTQNIVCAKTDGTLWAWGRNDVGNLGLGDAVNKSSPIQVGALTIWAVPSVTQRSVTCTQS